MVAFMHTGTRLTAGYRYTTLGDATDRTGRSRGFYLKMAITAMLPKLEEFHWNQVAADFEEKTINNLFNQIMLNGLKDEPEEQQ